MIERTSRCIVLAAGGTGGHVFPAEALARELLDRGCRLTLVTDRRGAGYGGALAEVETRFISAGAMAGRGPLAKFGSLVALGLGTFQARGILKDLSPNAVVGFGGYPSVPTVFAATRAKIPTLIHEQNAVLGRANRFLASRVTRIATTYEANVVVAPRLRAKAVKTGMPARTAIIASRNRPYLPVNGKAPINLLVLGGSQGARVFSEVVPHAIGRLPEGLRRRLKIAQHCRPEDIEDVRRTYEGMEVGFELSTFFNDVPERLASAHLLIARAGASTLSELTAVGRPAILVPYPFAADDHQTANAKAMEEVGAGWMMRQSAFDAATLSERLDSLLSMPGILEKTAACARASGRIDAARRLADEVLALANGVKSECAQTRKERGV